MAKAADLGALLAKIPAAANAQAALEKHGKDLAARGKGLVAQGKGLAAQGKRLAVKGLLLHYLISGLCFGSMLLVLWGGFSLLSRSLDPAAAAILLGLAVGILLVGGGLLATRVKDD